MDRRRQRGQADEGEKLGPKAYALTVAGITVTLSLVIIGVMGVLVLFDEQSEVKRFGMVGNSQFGALWKKMTEKNPFFTTIFVNGGMVSSIFFFRKLWDHKKALKAEAKRQKLVGTKKQS